MLAGSGSVVPDPSVPPIHAPVSASAIASPPGPFSPRCPLPERWPGPSVGIRSVGIGPPFSPLPPYAGSSEDKAAFAVALNLAEKRDSVSREPHPCPKIPPLGGSPAPGTAAAFRSPTVSSQSFSPSASPTPASAYPRRGSSSCSSPSVSSTAVWRAGSRVRGLGWRWSSCSSSCTAAPSRWRAPRGRARASHRVAAPAARGCAVGVCKPRRLASGALALSLAACAAAAGTCQELLVASCGG